MKPDNQTNFDQVQEILRLFKLQGNGHKLPLAILVIGIVFMIGFALPSKSPALAWVGAWFVLIPISYIMAGGAPRVPNAVLVLVSKYEPNNPLSRREFEAFTESFRAGKRRYKVLRWCSLEQDYLLADLRADAIGESK